MPRVDAVSAKVDNGLKHQTGEIVSCVSGCLLLAVLIISCIGVANAISGPKLGWSVFGLGLGSFALSLIALKLADIKFSELNKGAIAYNVIVVITAVVLGILAALNILPVVPVGGSILGVQLALCCPLTCYSMYKNAQGTDKVQGKKDKVQEEKITFSCC